MHHSAKFTEKESALFPMVSWSQGLRLLIPVQHAMLEAVLCCKPAAEGVAEGVGF